MKYDYGRKHIAKHTGLTGVEAGNIARSLKKRGIDFMTVDWETIGGDMYGHGKRSGGVKHHLKNMYGISVDAPEVDRYESQGETQSIQSLVNIFEQRSRRSKRMDLRIAAKNTFKHTDIEGVKLWKKYPNQYDIIGVDDPIEF